MKRRYKPMLAQSAKAPFTSKDWIFEIKWDGFRAISYTSGGKIEVRSRNDKELRYTFPELEELGSLAGNTVLDGEIVVMQDGRPDFQALLERNRANPTRDIRYQASKRPAIYVVFDVLEKDGKSLVHFPLFERKRILKESVREGKNVIVSEFVETDGESYFQAALEKGLEGIMAKKIDSPYEPGVRSSNWLKIKEASTCDCVIFGYTRGEGDREKTFGALILGLYDPSERLYVYVGKVGTGFSQSVIELLLKTFSGLRIEEKTLQDVDVAEEVTWLKPELVGEVVYQSVTKDERLRMPRFRGLRVDKPPMDCTLDQIRSQQENWS
ncbi:MAG TPA: non-homologous end-joining DNA ligase [Candidatus Bathyarchaeia archaeon]|nr:non-homologous end-joining DNA ligase [Candidatus Bathyarchaeia archaeon]